MKSDFYYFADTVKYDAALLVGVPENSDQLLLKKYFESGIVVFERIRIKQA